ncbi:AfsR/SARP family transcriptional regulator [Virgisporangium aurantiacum]|uniref:AfsR/SARP family transcriptional regulator n=1 Tax=Virgisporangium aurantiacum TaxID=175570 RepID=UPI00194F9BBB|nr:BTAD domain-containing putative transcriptional regulator [Virgisporangium aurantiacum]
MLSFRVLGPLRVTISGEEVGPAGARPRRLLTALVLRIGRPVSMPTLVDAVWGPRPPPSAVNTVQSYVSRLRRPLGAEVLARTGDGYTLWADGGAVDARRFEALVVEARAAGPHRAVDLLDRALELWTGEAYPDLAHHGPAAAEAARLVELHLAGREHHAEALVSLGRPDEAVAALGALTREHPLRQRAWRALMVALHRTGRQADALAAFLAYEAVLADLGLEPATEVKSLRTAILAAPESVRAESVRADRALDRPAAGPVPAQLPAPATGFTGRAAHLDRLDQLIPEIRPDRLVIAAIAGTAGIGKTALALHWAHRVRDNFDGGQLFVDLRGWAADPPVPPIDALTGFLRALGVPPEQVPVRLDQAGALLRTLAAGRRLLVVLDNARDVDQVRPLLPGAGGLVLITGRERLTGLVARDGALPIGLGLLRPDEARDLLARLLGPARVAAEPGAADDLADACAHLPLALRVAAAALAWHPGRSIGGYVAMLRANRLAALAVDGDPETAVGAAFDASYAALPGPARRLFRLFGLVPGPTINAGAAAALAAEPERDITAALARLAAAHLLDEPEPGRYTAHDLLRCYAAERAHRDDLPAERAAATARLHDWYLSVVDGAADLLYPHMLRLPGVAPDSRFADRAAAVAWLDAERVNLVAAVRAAVGPPATVARLADRLRGYFHLGRHMADWMVVAGAGLAAARRAGDPWAEAAARLSLGTACRSVGEHRAALRHYGAALRLARRCGWRACEATTLGNLGIVGQTQGRLRAAARLLAAALAVDRDIGRRAGIANNLGQLAAVYHQTGRLREATAHFQEAVTLNAALDSRHGEALALTGLGQVCHERGLLAEAGRYLDRAGALYAEVGDRDGQALIHHRLAAVGLALDQVAPARTHALTALALSREIGDPRTESAALNVLAAVYLRAGDRRRAAEHHHRAHDVAGAASTPRQQIEALTGLAAVALADGDHAAARCHAALALHQATTCGYRVLAADAHAVLARVAQACGHPDEADRHARADAGIRAATGYALPRGT